MKMKGEKNWVQLLNTKWVSTTPFPSGFYQNLFHLWKEKAILQMVLVEKFWIVSEQMFNWNKIILFFFLLPLADALKYYDCIVPRREKKNISNCFNEQHVWCFFLLVSANESMWFSSTFYLKSFLNKMIIEEKFK